MKTNSTQVLLYAAYLIDAVIFFGIFQQNAIFQSWIQENVPFLDKVMPPMGYSSGLLWLLISASFVVLQTTILKHKFYQKEQLRPRLSKAFFFGIITVGFYTGHYIFENPPVIDLLNILVFIICYFLLLGQISQIFRPDKSVKFDDNTDKMMLIKASDKVVSNEYSFNFKTNRGFVNILNPFRGMLLIGTAGSGKTYSFIEPVIDQAFQKEYTAFIYDFKFPNLAEYTWNSFQLNYKNCKLRKPKFFILYFKDIRYSNRCNPLHPTILKEKAFALQASKTILYNINPEWSKKQGEFFSSSAVAICQAIMWFLRLEAERNNRNISTLPHLIEMASFPNTAMLVEVLLSEKDVATIITPIKAAMVAGASEQLAGQVASLQIGLSSIVDNKMYYVMSDNDFSLDINNPEDPKIVILGNDDALKQAYAPALSLFASTLANSINQKNRRHCLYCIDEFPTMYIMNVENLPNTGRSNKICTFLGLQNFYQSEQVYGKDASQVINASFANIIMGQTNDKKTAEFAQDILGQYYAEKRDLSLQFDTDGGSHSIKTERKKIIDPDDMFELDAGIFVGKVADAGGEGREKKFFAKFEVKKQKHDQTLPFMNKELANLSDEQIDQILNENTLRIKEDVNNLIIKKYFTIKASSRLLSNPELIDFINQKVLSLFFGDKFLTDLKGEELKSFEEQKAKAINSITGLIVEGCIRVYHETEARGGKAITNKLSVEEFTLRQNFSTTYSDADGTIKENPNSPFNIIEHYFLPFQKPSSQKILIEEVLDITEEKESGDLEDLPELQDSDSFDNDDTNPDIERLNYYINEVRRVAIENLEVHSIIEEFISIYYEELDQITEYCKLITQGASENLFDYVYDFIAYNGSDSIIRYHKAYQQLNDYCTEEEVRNKVLSLLTEPDQSELETADLDESLPNIERLCEVALETIRKKLQLEFHG